MGVVEVVGHHHPNRNRAGMDLIHHRIGNNHHRRVVVVPPPTHNTHPDSPSRVGVVVVPPRHPNDNRVVGDNHPHG